MKKAIDLNLLDIIQLPDRPQETVCQVGFFKTADFPGSGLVNIVTENGWINLEANTDVVVVGKATIN